MRIGIDLRTARTNLTGTGTYTRNLYRTLLELDKNNEYFPITLDWQLKSKNIITKFINAGLEFLKLQILPTKHVINLKLNLLHFPANICSFALPTTKVVTIHDLGFLSCPLSYDKFYYRYLKYFVEMSAKRSDAIITVSESSKNDIINYYNIDPDKIWVTYQGVSDSWKKIPKIQARENISNKFTFSNRPYILSLGELLPRKNLTTLLNAYALLHSRYKRKIPDLVFIGPDTMGLSKDLKCLAKELSVIDHVHFYGFVDQTELINILNAAEMLAFISLYEGFGIPLVEAMICEVPILASNVSSIPEVVGTAAILVDPRNVEEIATGLERVIYDSRLRENLSNEGIQRARLYTWQKAAEKTVLVYSNFLH